MKNNRSFKNSIDFIMKIKEIEIAQRYKLPSLNIINLYTSILINETFKILKINRVENKMNKEKINVLLLFTMEIENENKLKFLDITITKD